MFHKSSYFLIISSLIDATNHSEINNNQPLWNMGNSEVSICGSIFLPLFEIGIATFTP